MTLKCDNETVSTAESDLSDIDAETPISQQQEYDEGQYPAQSSTRAVASTSCLDDQLVSVFCCGSTDNVEKNSIVKDKNKNGQPGNQEEEEEVGVWEKFVDTLIFLTGGAPPVKWVYCFDRNDVQDDASEISIPLILKHMELMQRKIEEAAPPPPAPVPKSPPRDTSRDYLLTRNISFKRKRSFAEKLGIKNGSRAEI